MIKNCSRFTSTVLGLCTVFLGLSAPSAVAQGLMGVHELRAEDFTKGEAATIFDAASLYTKLKSGVTKVHIDKMQQPMLKEIATAMLDKTYNVKTRAQSYGAYTPIKDLSKKLTTNTYSRFENPTGICFKKDETIIVIAKGVPRDKPLALTVNEFGPDGGDSTYLLKDGVNVFKAQSSGNAYVSYYSEQAATAPNVAVHIMTGTVNGVFRAGGTNETWKKLLSSCAEDAHIDLLGKYVHLVYPAKSLKQYSPDKGKELLEAYDKLMGMQRQVMGFFKYNENPKNHIFGRVIYRGFMHADGLGAAFHVDTLKELADADKIFSNSWGVSHEFGHVNQHRPAMMWTSTTEVTNNIFSSWANYLFHPQDMRLEHENCDGEIGGRFNAYLNEALVHGRPWLLQKGPDGPHRERQEGERPLAHDHFVKLGPLWQLQLYFAAAGKGNKDLYPDLFHKARNTDSKGKTNGQLQLEFMKNCMDFTKQNLSDFFVRTGMLRPVDEEMDDYRVAHTTITQKDCDALIAYGKKYPAPKSSVIYYINANNVEAYKNELHVTGTLGNGVSQSKPGFLRIDHATWKNAVAFEAYDAEGAVVRITMSGTGTKDNAFTLAKYPADATCLKAVSWDGKRTVIYGKK